MSQYATIRELIDRVRRRWRTLQAFQAIVRAALAAALPLALFLVIARWTTGLPALLAAAGAVAFGLAIAGVVWGLRPLRDVPDDRHVARFIEERESSLEDRLVSAVDVADRQSGSSPPGLADAMIADAARRSGDVDVDAIMPSETVRRAGFQAVAASLVVIALLVFGRHTARQAADALALTLFPARVTLEVTPGNAKIKAGTPLTIEARLVGNSAPVAAQLQVAAGDAWRAVDMATGRAGSFRHAIDALSTSFRYRVAAGGVLSPTYEVVVVRPPAIARIDVDYTFPSGLNLKPRTERDSGDIYAPAGTDVRLHIVTDRPAATGRMTLADGRSIELAADKANELSAGLKVAEDGSYRVSLVDREGLSSAGDTEYFIRVLEDRPPDVRLLKPASDRSVTPLEEVDIEAQAEDDYGVDRLDLVYSIRGEGEHVVPLRIPRAETTVSGRHTLFLEDLNVRPGDFVAYYVRARDLTRGTRPNEARSDIFFLEVKPYEQEFALAQSLASVGAGSQRGSIDDLVAAQKEIIVATWKLDRRTQAAKAKSEQDIRSVARAEAELKTRVEQASSGFRETSMRDPRRRTQPQRGGRAGAPPGPDPLRAGQTMPEEDEMTAAAAAMEKAVASLEALKTADARAPEMEALDHLLKAQADVKRREVSRQQAGSGVGGNRSNYDLSTLFDRELQKQQQTNYETRSTAENREDPSQSALDKIRDLARRQDELRKKQEELARNRAAMTEEDIRRELEKLTREQSELRQKAEELAQQMARQKSAAGQQQGAGGQQQGAGDPMRQATEAMRNAANDLRRQDPRQAAASGARALDRLRDLERQMQAGRPDDRRRAMGDMQLEARQLADAQRQVASELGKAAAGEAGKDTVRRLAGEQDRLAERARRLQEGLKQQPAGADAGREIERQKLADRMQQSAEAMRAAADRGAGTQRGSTAPADSSPAVGEAKGQAGAQQDVARAFDRVADKLAAATGSAQDGETEKLSSQRARAQELQQRLDQLTNEMKQLGARNGAGRAAGQSSAKAPGDSGRSGQGQGGGAGIGNDAARLRDGAQRAMRETRELLEQLRQQDQSFSRGGAGFTFEGEGMTTTAPGTEAFKQDFAKWDDLRRQATLALENAQTAISKKLQARDAKERLAAGAGDKAPLEYQKQVDDYFKAIAAKKKGS